MEKHTHLPQDPSRAMAEAIEHIEVLQDICARETEALQSSDTKTFLDLQQAKTEAAHVYQLSVREIIRRKEEMQNVDPKLKAKLAAMQQDFTKQVKDNMSSLSRMRNTVQHVHHIIHRAVKDSVEKERRYSYGEDGALESKQKKSSSIGLNETA